MRSDTAERLLRAAGAPSTFIDDVLGDLEELRATREHAGQPSGRWWYSAEVVRLVPHALRSGFRGTSITDVMDWGQKALAAWILMGVAATFSGGLTYGAWAALTPSAQRPAIWIPSDLMLAALLIAAAAHYLLLGYVAAWLERDRPIFVTLAAALLGVSSHTLMVQDGLREAGIGVLVVPMLVGLLIMMGGVWRVTRVPLAPRAA